MVLGEARHSEFLAGSSFRPGAFAWPWAFSFPIWPCKVSHLCLFRRPVEHHLLPPSIHSRILPALFTSFCSLFTRLPTCLARPTQKPCSVLNYQWWWTFYSWFPSSLLLPEPRCRPFEDTLCTNQRVSEAATPSSNGSQPRRLD